MEQEMCGIDLLSFPKPVLFEIGKKIEEIKDLINFCSTCKKLRSLKDSFWPNLLQKHYPKSYDQKMNEEECKRRYKAIHRIKPKIVFLLIQNLKENDFFLDSKGTLLQPCKHEDYLRLKEQIKGLKDEEAALLISQSKDALLISNTILNLINASPNLDFKIDLERFKTEKDQLGFVKDNLNNWGESNLYFLSEFLDFLELLSAHSEKNQHDSKRLVFSQFTLFIRPPPSTIFMGKYSSVPGFEEALNVFIMIFENRKILFPTI